MYDWVIPVGVSNAGNNLLARSSAKFSNWLSYNGTLMPCRQQNAKINIEDLKTLCTNIFLLYALIREMSHEMPNSVRRECMDTTTSTTKPFPR